MLSLRRKTHSCARAHTHKHTLKENAIAQLAQSLRCTPFVHNGTMCINDESPTCPRLYAASNVLAAP
jgi:hypothetical protein